MMEVADVKRILGQNTDWGLTVIHVPGTAEAKIEIQSSYMQHPGCAKALDRMKEFLRKERHVDSIDVSIV